MTGFRDLLAAERIKITSLPGSWVALALACGGNLLLGAVAAADAVRIAGPVDLAALLLVPVYEFAAIPVLAAGGEYRGGQVRVSLLAVPRRARLFAAKLTASTAAGLAASVPAVLPGQLLRDVRAADLLAVLTVYVLLALVGYGFAVVARSAAVPLAVLTVLAVLVAPLLRGGLPYAVRLLPHEAALSFLGTPAEPATALGPGAGLLVLSAWAALSVTAAWWVFARRDG